jgi:dephospho-CoA kinase
MEPGQDALQQIIERFGAEFINSDGTLDRRGFANSVFGNNEKVKILNEITHPAIKKIVIERSSGNKIYMINTPLLFEAEFDKFMDYNIIVTANENQVLSRGSKRDKIPEDEIKERLKHQIPLKEKVKLADYIIDNSGSIEHTKGQVVNLWKILIQGRMQ